ncbi:hypothetical protein [Allohahella marinimesophila]|uniref:Tetratricopeptide repeat protein n=1 Tax=Allohahella marinimesophila TaxID=1054972 RepID=A0ABP7NWP0_9GAMM
MSLLNDVLRDLDKRNAGGSEGPPDGVPPGLFNGAGRQDRSGPGFGRGQLMRVVVWVLILLSLITALVVGWRSLDMGRQALDRIPVDQNLQAVPRDESLDGVVRSVPPLPANLTAPGSALTRSEASRPVPASQYPPPVTAALAGRSPGEPESGYTTEERTDRSGPASTAPEDPRQPTVTVVGETEVIVTDLAAESEAGAGPVSEPVVSETAAVASKPTAPEQPQARQQAKPPRSAPAASPAAPDMKAATLAARRLEEARALQAAGQTEAALALFDQLESSIASPARAPALFSFKAGLLQQQGHYDEAARLYATLLKMKTADAALIAHEARWWSGLAIALEQLRQAGRAHAAWLNALSAGGLPATMRSYAAARIEVLGKAGITPDYQTVLDVSAAENNSQQDQR